MTAELPRLARAGDRHPWDWYVEEPWVTHRLIDHVPFAAEETILDPACGLCHIPTAFAARGFRAFGTDREQRTDSPLFFAEHDWLGDQALLIEHLRPLSIVMNPPFSYQDGRLVRGLAEAFVRRALGIATHKVAALLPLKWLASQSRCALFTAHPPAVYVLSERPSMPPGDQLAALGDRAYAHGKVDYAWFIWDKLWPNTDGARIHWIAPRSAEQLAEAA
ncbi:MAG: hypothetical protein A4S12_06870 [Proteobacteria bacterium SG_bin5]|nr:hypothetical protein [Sphingomonas sp.]OQW42055.1 MAG: hypothetical protein A4S12_06870 [Proteobacteria bacterium SG_bin5]